MGQACSQVEAHKLLLEDLNLPVAPIQQQVDESNKINVFTVVTSNKWLQTVSTTGKISPDVELNNLIKNGSYFDEVMKPTFKFNVGSTLIKCQVNVLRKDINFSLLHGHNVTSEPSIHDILLTFSRKQNSYQKKYLTRFTDLSIYKEVDEHKENNWSDLKILLRDIFQVPVINLNRFSFDSKTQTQGKQDMHMLPILSIIESDQAVFILEPFPCHTLCDALTYSPAVTRNNHINLMFVVYQLLQLFQTVKNLNFKFVDEKLHLSDIFLLHNSVWLAVSPFKCLHITEVPKRSPEKPSLLRIYNGSETVLRDESIQLHEELTVYTREWSKGNISNFDYLVIINKLAGRKFGDPLNHPVFPWVTDFTSPYNGYRDLTKSKFRLNKGDRQLDATFSSGATGFYFGHVTAPSVQHHVSDVLSDITYYIYHARDTPKDILCSHVRSRWVPDEYPSSMERIYEWTPDECIPEFFYNENIFKSIHKDMPYLNVPEWLSSPKEFVEYHHKILESNFVSKSLHCWIDLIFGYKLSDTAATEAKNVHLSLVDQHTDLRNYGIVQLFSTPHPQRKHFAEEEDFSKYSLDKLDIKVPFRDVSASWEYVDITSSMKKNKLEEQPIDQEDFMKRKKAKSFYDSVVSASATNPDDDLVFPTPYDVDINSEDIKFLDILEETEEVLLHELSTNPPDCNSLGVYEFGSIFHTNEEDDYWYVNEDTKLLICLIIEIALQKEMRTLTHVPPLDDRLKKNVKFFQTFRHLIPSCIQYAVEDLLDKPTEPQSSPTTVLSISSGFNFPSYFSKVHNFLGLFYTTIGNKQNTILSTEEKLKLSADIEKCIPHLQSLLDNLSFDGLQLLLLFLTPLFEVKHLQINMFLHIFPPVCVALGPTRSRSVFLKDLQKIYDSINTADEASLLTQIFLSKVLSSFGQDTFLHCLMTLILDVFGSNVSDVSGSHIYRKTSISVPIPSELTYQSDSMMSYEMSPCLVTDVDSILSFNLDGMFGDQSENMVILSKDYTHSFTEDTGDLAILNSDLESSLCDIQTPNKVETDICQTNLPVLSSQEVHSVSGTESLIEIDRMTESFGEYSSSFSKNEIVVDKPKVENSFSNDTTVQSSSSSIPFTMLLSNESSTVEDGFEKAREVLEEVPQEEELGIKESDDDITFQHVDIYQTVVESVKWLMPWIGPVLTTEYVARPLLRKMSKIFIDTDGSDNTTEAVDNHIKRISPIIDCLIEVALLYGDNIVMCLYLPHVAQLIESGITSPSVSISLGSNLVSSVQLMTEACKMLQPESILTHVEEFSVDFFQPLIRLLSTVKPFSTGSVVKEFLSRKLIDILGLLCQRLKREVAQDIMAPLLQQFFSCFDGIYALRTDASGECYVTRKYSLLCQSFDKNNTYSKKRSSSSADISSVRRFSGFDEVDNTSFSLRSPRISNKLSIDDVLQADKLEEDTALHDEQFADIYDTFSPSLAYHAYVLFCRVMGPLYIEKTLYNSDLVWNLFTKHDECLTNASMRNKSDSSNEVVETDGVSSKRSSTIGNWQQPLELSPDEETKYTERSSWQHIDGKWFEHWNECKDIDVLQNLDFKDMKLQTYAGHSSVIRDFYVPDNEHYFLSASRDKTVKLWLLKNHGNGTAHLGYSRTYDRHTRAVFSIQGIESRRVVASCDGSVHIWDPVTGTTVCEFDVGRGSTITSMRTLPAPSTCLAVATTEGNMRLYDVRQKMFAQKWKLSPQPNIGMIRSICTNEEGSWIAAGFSSGIVSVMDLQAGILRGQARVHDGEIMQMEAAPGYGFISASVDSNLRMWHEDGNVSHILKSSNDSIHTVVYTKQQLMWSTTSNKLNIHSKERFSSFHEYRIGQDAFKGAVSKMAFLPISRLYLFGADNGNVMLYA